MNLTDPTARAHFAHAAASLLPNGRPATERRNALHSLHLALSAEIAAHPQVARSLPRGSA